MILIIGGCGFIGKHLQKELKEEKIEFKVIDKNLSSVEDGIEGFQLDISEIYKLENILRNVKIIINLSGEKKDKKKLFQENVKAQSILAEKISKFDNVEKIIHLSSIGVLGANPFKKIQIDETFASNPKNLYEKTKLLGEMEILKLEKYKKKVIIFRPANVFGELDPANGMLNLIKIIKNKKFKIFLDEDIFCNYLYVKDLVWSIIYSIKNNLKDSIYHLSDSYPLRDLVIFIHRQLCLEYKPSIILSKLFKVYPIVRPLLFLFRKSLFQRLDALNSKVIFKSDKFLKEVGTNYKYGLKVGMKNIINHYKMLKLI